jgi:putative pyoverdin transport system ATP-binding/permease protein
MKLIGFFVRCSRNVNYSKRIVFAAILAGFVGGATNTLVLVVVNHVLTVQQHVALPLVLSFVALCLVLAGSKFVSQALLVRFATGTTTGLRVQLSRQILASPLRKLEEIGAARLLAVFTEDVPNVSATLTQVPNLCINFVIVVGCLVYMAWLSWLMFLLVMVTVVITMGIYHLLVQRSTRYFEAARNAVTELMKNFSALVHGNKELQLHRARRIAFIKSGIEDTAQKVATNRVASTTTYALAEAWGETLIFVVIGLLLFGFASLRHANATVLTGFVIAFLYMMTPLQFVLNTFPQIGQADVGIRSIEKIRKELGAMAIPEAAPIEALPAKWRRLELMRVSHTYFREKENSKFTLGPINLVFEPGSLVFITGGNGSGKTTLIKILTGLYAAETGEIRLDGKPIHIANADAYRQLFSAVFSDFFLFDQLHGMVNVDEDAKRYLNLLQLEHKVSVKDGKFSTIDLSQGQRKRLALLIAYLEDRPIYVFDEWAADQDALFRDIFYHQLLPDLKRRGKSVFVISHDERYYHIADRLIRLDYGGVESDEVLQGSPVPTQAASI